MTADPVLMDLNRHLEILEREEARERRLEDRTMELYRDAMGGLDARWLDHAPRHPEGGFEDAFGFQFAVAANKALSGVARNDAPVRELMDIVRTRARFIGRWAKAQAEEDLDGEIGR